MNTRARINVLLLALCALALSSCAGRQQTASNKNLKLETIRRPDGTTVYLFRGTNDPSPAR